MLKRYFAASLVAGLAFAAQSAIATDLWFYPGHGWLAQPPLSSSAQESDRQTTSMIAAPAASTTKQAANPQATVAPRASFTAPYDKDGGYFN